LKIIHRIKEKIITKDYEITIPHFLEEMLKDKLNLEDIEQAIINGSIRRKFTRDHRGIRYEVVGRV
jgi:hypothetical protein